MPKSYEWNKKRDYPTDATRPRRWADDARKAWYRKHRTVRFARRQLGA